ncbi:NAD(P)/FAD-dependent oxidoreductase [Rhodobacterales bacterium HKCCE2091]|nr:NAD(P)/FAD-dependent oxidoreductase [Rhodobacterales bacterium HKCCE2091]
MFNRRYDAVVVGARCAGAATAMLMAREGKSVLLVDWAEPGTDTLSSHCLTRGATRQLHRWGLTGALMARGTPRVNRSTFHFGDETLPVDIRPVGDGPGMMAPRRFVLDSVLVEAAAASGATVAFHTGFRDVLRDGSGRVCGALLADGTETEIRVAAPLVIGADGLRSTVARRVGAAVRAEGRNALGHVYSYFRGLPLRDNHAFFGPDAAAYSTSTNGGAECVIATTTPGRLRDLRARMDDNDVLRHLAHEADPGFGRMLDAAERTEPVRVFAGTPGRVRDCAGAGWALVGDAGYFRDPVTAHGITDAFRDAELLASAACVGTDAALAAYQAQRDEATAGIWQLTERIAGFDLGMEATKAAFLDLSQAMRAEQAWMDARFAEPAMAA